MRPNAAFLLAQVGGHAAEVYASLLTPLRLTPAHSGIVWLLSRSPGISQQEMASTLRVHPSRIVGLLDELEQRGYVERRASEQDRRVYSLHLTKSGDAVFGKIQELAAEHQTIMCSSLSDADCRKLADLLQRIAEDRGLALGVHPGYRWLGKRVKPTRS